MYAKPIVLQPAHHTPALFPYIRRNEDKVNPLVTEGHYARRPIAHPERVRGFVDKASDPSKYQKLVMPITVFFTRRSYYKKRVVIYER
jgi:hypothetical protein